MKHISFFSAIIYISISAVSNSLPASEFPPPPTPLEFQTSIVSNIPSGVKIAGVQCPKWITDEWVIGAFTVDGFEGETVGIFNVNTGEFRNLCQSLGKSAWKKPSKIRPFPDGSRFSVEEIQGNDATGIRTITIAECFPNILGCTSIRVLPVEGVDCGGIQNREPKPGYDGKTLFWTRVRITDVVMLAAKLEKNVDGDAWVAKKPRVLNPLPSNWKQSVEGIMRRGAAYEFKTTSPSGIGSFSSTMSFPNFDNYLLNLDTGEIRRLTKYAGWDEGVDIHPAGNIFRFGSSRVNSRAFEAAALVPRPGGSSYRKSIFEFPYYLDNPEKKRGLLETWVLDMNGDREGGIFLPGEASYHGQQITGPSSDGFEHFGGGSGWSPNGTRMLSQQSNDSGKKRLVLFTFTNITPVTTVFNPLDNLYDRIATWAPLLTQYPEPDESYDVTITAPAGGTVRMQAKGEGLLDFPVTRWVAVFTDYETADGVILNGREETSALGSKTQADIIVSGSKAGFFKSDVTYWVGLDGYIKACGYNDAKFDTDSSSEEFVDKLIP